jgi:hypothetical protein
MTMLTTLKQKLRTVFPNLLLAPQGDAGVRAAGHRKYVGGAWDEIGKLQFDFLVAQGMRPENVLLDIACGAFRLGVKAVPFLDRGHYLGIEKEQALIDLGIAEELGPALVGEKAPELVVSSAFEFEKFTKKPDFAIAQSLFTHLTPEVIDLCFAKLRPAMKDNTRFLGTYFLAAPGFKNPKSSHDHGVFAYSQAEMCGFGERNGFRAEYIGDWKHPRSQVIVAYTI